MNIYRTSLFLFVFCSLSILVFSEEIKKNEQQIEKNSNKVRNPFISDTLKYKSPNAILKIFGYRPTFIDTIEIHDKIDSFQVLGEYNASFNIRLIEDSTKIICQLDSTFINNLIQKNNISITAEFVKDTLKSKEKIILKAITYGNWIYFLIGSIIVIMSILFLIFGRNKKLQEKFKKFYNKIKNIFIVTNKEKTRKVEYYEKLETGEGIKNIQENLSKILKTVQTGNIIIVKKIDELKKDSAQIKDYEKKINEKEEYVQRLKIEKETVDKEKSELEKKHEDQIKKLSDKIEDLIKEKKRLEDENEKLRNNYNLLKSRQSEILSKSLQIIDIDKKKMGIYNEVCKNILKVPNDLPRIIYKQSLQNVNLLNEFNSIILDYFMGNYEEVYKFRDEIDNILIYQRTDYNLILDRFSGKLSIEFNEFDIKFKELIFDHCILGKVDKLLIGFQNLYSLKYKIEMSSDDINLYAKIYDQIKDIENELTLNLKLAGFEPYPINIFDELTVQKSDYIENIGGISLKDKFPLYEKKSEQKNLILQITQWAYKKNSGLWKNRKATVKISQ